MDYVSKRYLSTINFSRYVFSDGTEAHFPHNRLDVNEAMFPGRYIGAKDNPQNGRPRWQVYQDELDAILGHNPIIFVEKTLGSIAAENPIPPQNAATEAQVAADLLAAKALGSSGRTQQEVGAVGPGSGLPTDVNASTVDPAIAAAMLNSNIAGSVAARVAAAKNAGAASSVSGPGK